MGNDPLLNVVAIKAWAEAVGIAGVTSQLWGWAIAEALHFVGLCLLFGTVGFFDLRMLGVARGVSLRSLHRLIPAGLAGYGLSVSTGFLFVVSAPDQYIYNPAFQTKIALMVLAGVNMVLFYMTTARAALETSADGLPPLWARVSGGVSLFCWLGVITCGRVITAYRPPYHWCFWC